MMTPSRPGITRLPVYNNKTRRKYNYRSQSVQPCPSQESFNERMREMNAEKYNFGGYPDSKAGIRLRERLSNPSSSPLMTSSRQERHYRSQSQKPLRTYFNSPEQMIQGTMLPQIIPYLPHLNNLNTGGLSTLNDKPKVRYEAAARITSNQIPSNLSRHICSQPITLESIHKDRHLRRKGEHSHYDSQHSSPAKRPTLGSPFGSHSRSPHSVEDYQASWSKRRVFMQGAKPMLDPPDWENAEAKRERRERSRSIKLPPNRTPVNQASRDHSSYQGEASTPKTLHGYYPRRAYHELPTGHSSSSSADAIDMKELFKRNHRNGNAHRRNLNYDHPSYANVIPRTSAFHPSTASSDMKAAQENKSPPRSSEMKIHTFLENGQIQNRTPPVFSLLSSGENTPETPIKRSAPMKERIEPIKKAPILKKSAPTKHSASSRKTAPPKAKKAKNKAEEISPEVIRQHRAAQFIIEKEDAGETEAFEVTIFGAVQGDDEATKQKKLEAQRLEAQAAREAKAYQDALKKEADRLVEEERKRKADEAAEQAIWRKECEEAQKKAIRDVERKKAEATHERVLEAKRQFAAQKIEADRQKAAAEAEERERVRKEAEEKATSVQAEKNALAILKAKQEIAKKQAASLTASKLPNPHEVAMEPEGESSLFIPEASNPPQKRSFLDVQGFIRSRAVSQGPRNVAEVFTQSVSKPAVSGYRAEREALEVKIAADKALASRQRLDARWKASAEKRQAALPQKHTVIRQRAAAEFEDLEPRVLKQNCPLMKPKAKGNFPVFQIDDFGGDSETEASDAGGSQTPQPSATASQPLPTVNHTTGSFNSVNISFGSTKSAPAAPQSKVYTSSVKLISEVERETAKKRLAAENVAKKKARNEAQRLSRKANNGKKARQKKRQQLIEEAQNGNFELNEDTLEEKLDAFMAKREKEIQRRTENRLRKERIENFAPDTLILEGLRIQASSASSPEAPSNDTDEENDTTEARIRKSNQATTRQGLDALARARGSRFAQTAQKKTVADLQSDSEESEEDPDSDDQPNGGEIILTPDGSDDESVEVGDEAQERKIAALNPDDHDSQIVEPLTDLSASFEKRPSIVTASRNSNSRYKSDRPHKPSTGDQIHVYMVLQHQTVNGKELDQEVVEKFVSRDDANSFAIDRVNGLRKKYEFRYPAVSESYDDDLYYAQIWFDQDKQDGVLTRISRELQAVQDLANFDPSVVQRRLPEKSWMLRRTTLKYVEGGEENPAREVKESLVIRGFHYSNLVDANHAACKKALEFIRPKTSNIDWVIQYENSWGPMLRGARDQQVEAKAPFSVEISVDDEQLQWMKPLSQVDFEVEEFEMMGPIN